MLPFEQGGLDSLCGIYGLVNAERMINNTTVEESQTLFDTIIRYLDDQEMLAPILKGGMLLRHIKAILVNVIGDRIPYQKLHFTGVANPYLNTFWREVQSFLSNNSRRAVLLGISGFYDHWTIIKEISEKRIELFDSGCLRRINRINCTTADVTGRRHHVLHPAQTFFLGSA